MLNLNKINIHFFSNFYLSIQNAAVCKTDCNFGMYLSIATAQNINITSFVKELLANLPGNVVPNCKNTLPNNLLPLPPSSNNISSANILSSLSNNKQHFLLNEFKQNYKVTARFYFQSLFLINKFFS